MNINPKAKRALYLGCLCSVSYLAVYFARNILSAVTPQMIESSGFTNEGIGKISSAYFICYAIGQLVNGWLGDKIKARYMICTGLLLSGVTNLIFIRVAGNPSWGYVIYGLAGFFLSMIYGPMTKVIAENVELIYAPRCSLGYTFASFLASPMAGVFAAFLSWQGVFLSGSTFLILMAVVAFVFFWMFERSGVIQYGRFRPDRTEQKSGKIRLLIKRDIIRFSLISIIAGIVRTSVVFWLPAYLSQYLGYTADTSAIIFTVLTFIISFTTFVAVLVYEKLMRYHMERTILLMFSLSVLFFFLQYWVRMPLLNIVLMVLAIMSCGASATMLYSRYCPSLYDTGMVSSATGFLDALSYAAAAIASTVFANAVASIGWKNLILVWTGIVFCGTLVALSFGKRLQKRMFRDTI